MLLESVLRNVPGVDAVSRDGSNWRLTVREVHQVVPRLLTTLAERDAQPMHLATHHATLEDVFMTLTGRRLRDG
jgi:ABC-2 type transport system ATP-binding protein